MDQLTADSVAVKTILQVVQRGLVVGEQNDLPAGLLVVETGEDLEKLVVLCVRVPKATCGIDDFLSELDRKGMRDLFKVVDFGVKLILEGPCCPLQEPVA